MDRIADVAHRKHSLLFNCKFKLRMLFTHPAGKDAGKNVGKNMHLAGILHREHV